jgi:hypothetical protein
MDIHDILARLERDSQHHMTGAPSDEAEIRDLESKCDIAVPADYRAFLTRFGGGIFYQQHEIFGPRRVMIHDIEMVPDLLSMRASLPRITSEPIADGYFPLHRGGGRIHLIDLRPGPDLGRVLGGTHEFPSLSGFLEAVVVPAGLVG